MSAAGRRLASVASALCVVAGASGCFTWKAALPGALRPPPPDNDVVIVGRFDHTVTAMYFLYGVAGGAAPDAFAAPMKDAVERAGGDGVTNIIVDSYFDLGDEVIQVVTLGLVTPRTYRMRADIVRLSAPPLPGKPLVRGSGAPARRRSIPAPLPAPAPTGTEPPAPLDPAEPTEPAPPAPTPTPTDPDDGPRFIP